MKRLIAILTLILLSTITVTGVILREPSHTTSTADAAELDLYAMFNDTHIEFYEERVAKEAVVSNLSDRRLARLAEENSVTTDKMKKVLILQHAFRCQGIFYSTDEILAFSTTELIIHATEYAKFLKSTMPEQEFSLLVEDFKKLSSVSI